MKCQATFKEHCQHPKCDCDRPVTAAIINSTEFPRLERLMKDPVLRDERLAEIDAKLAEEYVGGMTEYWKRQRDFLMTEKGQEIMDVLDGPEQECYSICQKDMTKDTCPFNPRLGCDCGENPAYDVKMYPDNGDFYVTNPQHGGKVTCHTCDEFIAEGDVIPYTDHQHPDEFPKAHFHKDCYNPYEHYYGLDKPID